MVPLAWAVITIFRYDTSAMVVYCSPQDSYRSVAFAALDNIQANTPEYFQYSIVAFPAMAVDTVSLVGFDPIRVERVEVGGGLRRLG